MVAASPELDLVSMVAPVYAKRRRALLDATNNEPIILSAFMPMQWSNDDAGPYLQESTFYYLTGIVEPNWKLIVCAQGDVLIAPNTSDTHQLFEGETSWADAIEGTGVSRVLSFEQGEHFIEELLQKSNSIWGIGPDPHAAWYEFTPNPAPRRLWRALSKGSAVRHDVRSLVAAQRGIKDEAALSATRRAINLTADTFHVARQKLATVKSEYELEALFSYEFRVNNAHHAYAPIVAAGAHACTLHYGKNNTVFPKNGLVLIDIGARIDGYAADITRTYAVGTPSEREIAIHAAVETAHRRIIELIKPNVLLRDYSKQVDEIMKDALQQVGLLVNRDDTETYRKYFPHAISHGLGLDVHESLGGYDSFKPGMVLTVEPGIYIPEEGIGVRIEDDILVTEQGNENLSGSLSTAL